MKKSIAYYTNMCQVHRSNLNEGGHYSKRTNSLLSGHLQAQHSRWGEVPRPMGWETQPLREIFMHHPQLN